MPVSVFVVDAFTEAPFAGNPAAVCLLESSPEEIWMQNIAREMNLSETAFVYPETGGIRLRWFTPTVEVSLCGHATLATSHILWETGQMEPGEEICYQTRSGLLTARRESGWIELNFPAQAPAPVEPPPALPQSLGVQSTYVGQNAIPDFLVEVESEETVRNLRPDFAALATLPGNGVIVTARSNSKEFDFVSRYFAPALGVPEDPVTGAAHCCLAPYWSSRLGKNELLGYQASARGGRVRVRLEGNRVRLGGQAVTIMRGELLV